jgi:hypothetical protein
MKRRNITAVVILPILLLISISVLAASYPVVADVADGCNESFSVAYSTDLGFVTGAGWFYWPETTDKTNFCFSARFDAVNECARGSFLIIRQSDNGDVYRLRGNAFSGLALGEDSNGVGWASFSGEAIYSQDSIGSYQFLVYVDDWNEPGSGFDQFWIEVRDGDGNIVDAMSMDRDAVDNTETLQRGNIVVHR